VPTCFASAMCCWTMWAGLPPLLSPFHLSLFPFVLSCDFGDGSTRFFGSVSPSPSRVFQRPHAVSTALRSSSRFRFFFFAPAYILQHGFVYFFCFVCLTRQEAQVCAVGSAGRCSRKDTLSPHLFTFFSFSLFSHPTADRWIVRSRGIS